MKLSDRDKRLLLYIVGIATLALVYSLVYTKYNDKTTALENETASINNTINTLQNLISETESYQEEEAEISEENMTIMAQYPANVMTSDIILYVNSLANKHNIEISTVGMNQVTSLDCEYPSYDALSDTGAAITVTGENPDGIYLYEHTIEFNFESGYEDLKDALEDMLDDGEQKSIHSISLSYNQESGTLTGNITAGMYSMTGTGLEYARPTFSGIKQGTDNIFKTLESSESSSLEDEVVNDDSEDVEE